MKYVLEFEIIADLLFFFYLSWVSWQDFRNMQVVRYSHLPGLAAVFLRLICSYICGYDAMTCQGEHMELYVQRIRITCSLEACFCICLHLGLQIISQLCRFYGLADAIVLFLCGVYLGTRHGIYESFMGSMLLQAIAGILLFGVQILKKNVQGARFKAPVPYIPYIFFAFFLTNGVL